MSCLLRRPRPGPPGSKRGQQSALLERMSRPSSGGRSSMAGLLSAGSFAPVGCQRPRCPVHLPVPALGRLRAGPWPGVATELSAGLVPVQLAGPLPRRWLRPGQWPGMSGPTAGARPLARPSFAVLAAAVRHGVWLRLSWCHGPHPFPGRFCARRRAVRERPSQVTHQRSCQRPPLGSS